MIYGKVLFWVKIKNPGITSRYRAPHLNLPVPALQLEILSGQKWNFIEIRWSSFLSDEYDAISMSLASSGKKKKGDLPGEELEKVQGMDCRGFSASLPCASWLGDDLVIKILLKCMLLVGHTETLPDVGNQTVTGEGQVKHKSNTLGPTGHRNRPDLPKYFSDY